MKGIDQRVEAFEGQLRQAGLRMTQQRRLILRVLAEADDHPDAKGIFTRAFAHDPTLSLSTVYRTMKLLETQGAIERHAFEDGVSRYEHADQEHHDHLIDVETGTVVEFSSPEIEALQAKIAAELGYEIVRHRLELYGRKIKAPRRKPAAK
ncbi:Fur family transcriptional regulator [Bosea sp. (in: a-proteobacteria)]|jgi:Fur family ferric uptake transcriptional regulator|uniref:Fur family transcriptional regulator n=1 Tax=Bosea sp. (in: a-proteobacteria) TaxID=1871050 RepID=UPI00086CEA53|nr:Fur family transcriptional regulator [Bosea sp. (in: a-proteobacteria)]MBN9440476.1 transcriptional repressor [Bosea sp. (in: a-proteobacteria)]MBN9449640.1 transcriptional repressor [Bosea sp. (in: a-proteobacteria)]MBN9468344.1 transcriptional repressor [Bosea sp. (in: a-proteobacteria)]ODT46669.1 MAG: transcriptional repressor [Methylobacterium sp. SCN 67-24]